MASDCSSGAIALLVIGSIRLLAGSSYPNLVMVRTLASCPKMDASSTIEQRHYSPPGPLVVAPDDLWREKERHWSHWNLPSGILP